MHNDIRLRGYWASVPDRESQGVIFDAYEFQEKVWLRLFFPRVGGPTSAYPIEKVEIDYGKARTWDSKGEAFPIMRSTERVVGGAAALEGLKDGSVFLAEDMHLYQRVGGEWVPLLEFRYAKDPYDFAYPGTILYKGEGKVYVRP